VNEIHNHPVFAALSPQAREVIARNAPLVMNDATQVTPLANGKFVAVHVGTAPAKLLSVNGPDVFDCGWLVEALGYEGERYAVECGAKAVGFANGWTCANGHNHYSGQVYYDEDEIEGARKAGYSLAPGARHMTGQPV
jgi:hypothetical protein